MAAAAHPRSRGATPARVRRPPPPRTRRKPEPAASRRRQARTRRRAPTARERDRRNTEAPLGRRPAHPERAPPALRRQIGERLRHCQLFLSAPVKRDRLVVRIVLARPLQLRERVGDRAQVILGDAQDLAPKGLPLPLSSRDRQTHVAQRNQSTITPRLTAHRTAVQRSSCKLEARLHRPLRCSRARQSASPDNTRRGKETRRQAAFRWPGLTRQWRRRDALESPQSRSAGGIPGSERRGGTRTLDTVARTTVLKTVVAASFESRCVRVDRASGLMGPPR
jgi:hypothetical protein